jgi:hypothetical protein
MKKMHITSKAIQNKINKMDTDLQEAFYQEYNKHTKSYFTALFLAITGIHYLYFGKWLALIFFVFTAGGFGIWWFIDLFRVKSLTNNHNHAAAINAMREIDALR